MGLSYPKRKGNLHSFKSLEVLHGLEVFKGLTQFSAKMTVDGREFMYSTGSKPVGRPRGNTAVECSMKFLGEAFFDFVKSHPQFMTEEMDLTFVLQEGSRRDRVDILGLTFEECEINLEGTEGLEVPLTGMALDMMFGPSKTSLFEGGFIFGEFSAGFEFSL